MKDDYVNQQDQQETPVIELVEQESTQETSVVDKSQLVEKQEIREQATPEDPAEELAEMPVEEPIVELKVDKEEKEPDDPSTLRLDLYIEALIFAAEYALNTEEIRKIAATTFGMTFKKQHIQELIDNIRDKYEDDNLAIQLAGIAGGYLFMTKQKYHRIIGDFLKLSSKRKLSKAALETLSIIAYKQPIAKSEIEGIRGVNADYAVQKLLEKELIEISGRSDGPGRPLLYSTSTKFLNHFGIKDTGDLPKLKEFETVEDTIGVSEEEE